MNKEKPSLIFLSRFSFANTSEEKNMRRYFSHEILLNNYSVPGTIIGIRSIGVKSSNSKKTPESC